MYEGMRITSYEIDIIISRDLLRYLIQCSLFIVLEKISLYIHIAYHKYHSLKKKKHEAA